jgi:hypothetical protein
VTWTDIGQLLDQAEPAEQQVILQHFVPSLELKSADKVAERGTDILRLFPEVGPLDSDDGGNGHDPAPGSSGNGAVLTPNGLVRQFGEKAPRVGLSS